MISSLRNFSVRILDADRFTIVVFQILDIKSNYLPGIVQNLPFLGFFNFTFHFYYFLFYIPINRPINHGSILFESHQHIHHFRGQVAPLIYQLCYQNS
jgi:hypothetical protein